MQEEKPSDSSWSEELRAQVCTAPTDVLGRRDVWQLTAYALSNEPGLNAACSLAAMLMERV